MAWGAELRSGPGAQLKKQNPRRLRAGGGLLNSLWTAFGPLRRALTYAYYAYYNNGVDRQEVGETGHDSHEVIYKTKL